MTEYFDRLQTKVSELSGKRNLDGKLDPLEKFLEAVQDLERDVFTDVLPCINDREFPSFHRDAIVKMIDRHSFLRNFEGARDYLLTMKLHGFFGELHEAFHQVAAALVQTRFGPLTDDPGANVKAQRSHDGIPGSGSVRGAFNIQGVTTGRLFSGDPQQPPEDADHSKHQEEDGPGPELENGNVVITLEVTDPHRPLISKGKLPANIKICLELLGGCTFSSLDADEVISKINTLANSDRRENLKVYHNGELVQEGPAVVADCSECGGRWKGKDYADEMATAMHIRQAEESRTRGGMIQGKDGLAALAMRGKLSTDKD